MEQFSLEKYLKNPSKKIVTREGKPARIICTDAKFEKYPLVALITKKDGREFIAIFDTSGKYYCKHDSYLDLFFAPEKKEGWINIYKSGFGWSLGTNIWQTEEEAKKWIGAADYIATAKIEWEE